MEALILSCGTGGGHNAAGRAVCEEMNRRGHHAWMLNPYTLKSERLAQSIDRTYIKMAQKAPRMFGVVYHIGDAYRKYLPIHSPVYAANKAMVPRLSTYLDEHHVDVVVMPHVYPAEILTVMKDRGMQTPKMIFIATDYTCIPFTEETKCDAYVIAAKELSQEYLDFGIPQEKLYPLGIPVSRGFSAVISRREAKRALGLDTTKQYILISGGSIGAGKIERVLKRLLRAYDDESGVRIVMICGSNEKIYRKLQAAYADRAVILGTTDQMALYMKACSVFIGKPGGLSSTEAVVAGVPLLHAAPIPGCETKNVHFFAENGLSVNPDGKTLLQRTHAALQRERAATQHVINPNAAADICTLAERLCAQDGAQAAE